MPSYHQNETTYFDENDLALLTDDLWMSAVLASVVNTFLFSLCMHTFG